MTAAFIVCYEMLRGRKMSQVSLFKGRRRVVIYYIILVGGLAHVCFFHIFGNNSPTCAICFRGLETTKQYTMKLPGLKPLSSNSWVMMQRLTCFRFHPWNGYSSRPNHCSCSLCGCHVSLILALPWHLAKFGLEEGLLMNHQVFHVDTSNNIHAFLWVF